MKLPLLLSFACLLVTQSFAASSNGSPVVPLPSWVEIQLTLDETTMTSLEQSPRTWVKASVQMDGIQFSNVAIRIKGNVGSKTKLKDKPSWTLNLDKHVKGQKWLGLDKIHLNNSLQDPTYIVQALGLQLFRNAGMPAAHATHAWVKLNKQDLGCYVLVEGYDKTFLKREFGNADGLLYEGERSSDVDKARLKIGKEPIEVPQNKILYDLASLADEKVRLDNLPNRLDMESFQTFLALETITSHWDGYAANKNNYMAYLKADTGTFVFLPHGLDSLFQLPRATLFPDCAGQVAFGIFETAQGRENHQKRCKELLADLCSPSKILAEIQKLETHLSTQLSSKDAKGIAAWRAQVDLLRKRVETRLGLLDRTLKTEPEFISIAVGETVQLKGFEPWINAGDAIMVKTNSPDPALYLKPILPFANCKLSWRKSIRLPSGKYQFSALYEEEGFVKNPSAPGRGIFLRTYGRGMPRITYSELGNGQVRMQTHLEVQSPSIPLEVSMDYWGMRGTCILHYGGLILIRL